MTDTKPTTPITLSSPVNNLPGVGKSRAASLEKLGIQSVSDMLKHLPSRYEFLAGESSVSELKADTIGTARGIVAAKRWVSSGRGKGRLEVTLLDDGDTLRLVWFNAAYLQDKFFPGVHLRVTGKVQHFQDYPQMVNPKFETLAYDEVPEPVKSYRRPIYPATEKLASGKIEELITFVLDQLGDEIPDPLPGTLLDHHAMPTLGEAIKLVHRPNMPDDPGVGRRRLAYNELLLLQLGIELKRQYNHDRLQAPELRFSQAKDEHIRQRFGFDLTESQAKVITEIASDLQRDVPMNRLVQGDVGSGKTVIALYGLLMAVADGYQGALMAPTELLAEQHFLSMNKTLEGSSVKIGLLTAGQATAKSVARRELEAQIQAGEIDIIIGTQALVSESVQFNNLALVVVDEQHRFGVLQRAAFRSKMSPQVQEGRIASPHYLVMTATPIPRTLSLTLFGDLDVSTIHGLPPGRKPIITRVVRTYQSDDVYGYIASRVAKGEQVYVVVPAIDEAEEASENPLKSVAAHSKLLQEKYFSDFTVSSMHGRLKSAQRDQIMNQFRAGKVDVLVATTVIEVGVDVPNATMIVIEHAERFGLAQLHQLRGRIGRGTQDVKNLCVLICDPVTDEGIQRVDAIAATNDGFRIAEKDLEIRGMGDFFGTRQHGMPPLRVAKIPDDMDLLQLAKRDAVDMIKADSQLKLQDNQTLRRLLIKQYGDALGLIDVG
ncbi:MAG: ATP-dependent DNA helicase RecG [Phycisphaeraceae bacterium]|nr:ATP-dependent DNA helicase RecG [Phycisphaeraceae bacterium]